VNNLTAFFKKLRLRQVFTVLLAGVLLTISTACNAANVQGANPNNSPVPASGILYPGAETPAGRAQKETELPIKTSKDFAPKLGGLNQRNPDLGERAENRVEAATDAFKEAAGFVKDKADEAGRRPELQSNPALHK
jgi:hypothetical protein